MTLTLTKSEMLALWKRRHFLEPLRADCTVERSDGIDIDTIACVEMRLWYLRQLTEAPAEMLAPKDIAMTAKVRRSAHGTALITLPQEVVRVVAVKLAGWERPARMVHADDPAIRTGNVFARPGVAEPLATMLPDGTLELFSPVSEATLPAVDLLMVITDLGPESYVMNELLIETIVPHTSD